MIAQGQDIAAPSCPITGDKMRFWLHVPCDWRRPTVAESYDLYWSDASQYGQLFPRPSKSEIAAYYDTEYYTHSDNSQAKARQHSGFFSRLREHLAWRFDFGTDLTAASLSKWLPAQGHGNVLEIGCGDGKLLSDLTALGWAGVGVEPDSIARTVAIQRGLEVHNGTAEDPPLSLPTGKFDLVVMQHVLEHCLDPLVALRTAASFAKPGGMVIVETPNNSAKGCRSDRAAWPWLDVPRHLNFFTPHSLSAMCSAADLDVISLEYTGYIRQFQKPWMEARRGIIKTFGDRNQNCSSMRSDWGLLCSTMLSGRESKYDSVRVVARRAKAQ